ncbi:hypothetical protein PPACK8108_LOCUS21627 [Phakopsora pachyrhizi]|uniref:Uncharacterized protein n=1 Tax=Phakopsora pachyrhizi TaxID=170000 RepID=A0AAV0BHZ2_PHAPC|nr:hypothetical protein PPACK8108_LOCUS21627 [Phakopsora pachyrhizi]
MPFLFDDLGNCLGIVDAAEEDFEEARKTEEQRPEERIQGKRQKDRGIDQTGKDKVEGGVSEEFQNQQDSRTIRC